MPAAPARRSFWSISACRRRGQGQTPIDPMEGASIATTTTSPVACRGNISKRRSTRASFNAAGTPVSTNATRVKSTKRCGRILFTPPSHLVPRLSLSLKVASRPRYLTLTSTLPRPRARPFPLPAPSARPLPFPLPTPSARPFPLPLPFPLPAPSARPFPFPLPTPRARPFPLPLPTPSATLPFALAFADSLLRSSPAALAVLLLLSSALPPRPEDELSSFQSAFFALCCSAGDMTTPCTRPFVAFTKFN